MRPGGGSNEAEHCSREVRRPTTTRYVHTPAGRLMSRTPASWSKKGERTAPISVRSGTLSTLCSCIAHPGRKRTRAGVDPRGRSLIKGTPYHVRGMSRPPWDSQAPLAGPAHEARNPSRSRCDSVRVRPCGRGIQPPHLLSLTSRPRRAAPFPLLLSLFFAS